MATKTTNYGLTKPDGADFYDIGVQNNNMDTIDTQLKKMNDAETSHAGNKSNPHSVTKTQIGLGNVENKSSAAIRGEMTKTNVTTALGFTPANQTDMTNAQNAIKNAQNTITQLNSDKITGNRIKKLSWGGTELQCIAATIDDNTVYIPIMWDTSHMFLSTDGQVNNISWDGDHSRLVVKIGTTDVYVPIQWS